MIVMDLRMNASPTIVDTGDTLIKATMDFRATNVFPMGLPANIHPQWSLDGRWVYFLKQNGGFTQVWRADTTGQGSTPVSAVLFDVESFAIDDQHGVLLLRGRPGIQRSTAAIEREAATGFHYDDRYSPMNSNRPFPAKPISSEDFAFDMASHKLRPAMESEVALLRQRNADPGMETTPMASPGGWKAWLQSSGPGVYRVTLQVRDALGHLQECRASVCSGRLYRPFWTGDGKAVRYLRREGVSNGETALYEWTVGATEPRRMFATTDVLKDCQPIAEKMLCLRQGSTSPERIVLVDPYGGSSDTIFDPNPEFQRLRLGRVERLSWNNAFGIETIGDLVYPTDYKAGTRYPLIIVQYDTRGFLRGGTGDEYPIQAFANRGYAVLSFSRPQIYAIAHGATTAAEINRENLTDFADRKSVQSSLETAVQDLTNRGVIDPARVGITGLSDGGSTIEFGLINSRMFAAAASSSCCWDPVFHAFVGPAAAREFLATGYPKISDADDGFWRNIALSLNARRVKIPLLLQIADREYIDALGGFTALRENNAPVDLFVFPDEYHVKWQPAHRLAVYKRSLDWFDYWLKNLRSTDPARSEDLRHWDQLRREAGEAPATPVQ